MQHRDERRGLGGIFFDDLNDYDQEMLLSFSTGNSWTSGLLYLPLPFVVMMMICFTKLITIWLQPSAECANSVIEAYLPIIERRKNLPFTDQNKAWQQLRRGRYVEFNLVCNSYDYLIIKSLNWICTSLAIVVWFWCQKCSKSMVKFGLCNPKRKIPNTLYTSANNKITKDRVRKRIKVRRTRRDLDPWLYLIMNDLRVEISSYPSHRNPKIHYIWQKSNENHTHVHNQFS